jgi:hypothetical protein
VTIQRRKPIKRSAIKRRKKSPAKWARQFGSAERVEYVKSRPCANCGVVGFTENAHGHHEKAGMGQRASYLAIIPLCGPWSVGTYQWEGCHAKYDRHELFLPERKAAVIAANLETAWQSHQSENWL